MEIAQRCIIILIDHGNQPIVFSDTRPGQCGTIFIQNGIETVRVVTFAGEPFQPEAVG